MFMRSDNRVVKKLAPRIWLYSVVLQIFAFLFSPQVLYSKMDALVEDYELEPSPLRIEQLDQLFTQFDKVSRRFAILGFEDGSFEVWGYSVKILRNFKFSFLLRFNTEKIRGQDTARRITVPV